MKLSLIAAVVFALVVCQAEARNEEHSEMFHAHNFIPAKKGFHSAHGNRVIPQPRDQEGPRFMVVDKIIDKLKEVVRSITATLRLVQDLLDKSGFTNLANAVKNFIQIIEDVTNSAPSGRAVPPPYRVAPPPWLP